MAFGPLSRRMFLRHAPAAAAAGALVTSAALTLPALAAVEAKGKPTQADLRRYYSFLWLEFSRLSKEMGVPMHDSMTAYENGDMDAVRDTLSTTPSDRALDILDLLKVSPAQVVGTPL